MSSNSGGAIIKHTTAQLTFTEGSDLTAIEAIRIPYSPTSTQRTCWRRKLHGRRYHDARVKKQGLRVRIKPDQRINYIY